MGIWSMAYLQPIERMIFNRAICTHIDLEEPKENFQKKEIKKPLRNNPSFNMAATASRKSPTNPQSREEKS